MTALTPGCDPDMSTTGAPYGATPMRPRLGSGVVLMAVGVVSLLLVTGDSVSGLVAVPAGVVGALCGLALVGRGVRLARRAGAAVEASTVRALHRSHTVPTAAP